MGFTAPIITYLTYGNGLPANLDYATAIIHVWKDYVRPIAIGGMLVGAAYTLWKMRKSLITGIAPFGRRCKESRLRRIPNNKNR